MAFDNLKRDWNHFIKARPGERFEQHAERASKHSPHRRAAQTAVGGVAIVAGAAMMILPGPGGLAMAFGVALIAGNSKTLARKLDDAERSIRRRAKPASETG
jgi:ferric-dicitrate binding protein FerR (iron transport regulator)